MSRWTERSTTTSPKHRWRSQDRILLSLLDSYYYIHVVEATAIFNYVNRQTLLHEGFFSGIPVPRVVAQLNEYKRGGTGSSEYNEVNVLSFQEMSRIFRAEIRTIEDAARALSIRLVLKSFRTILLRPVSNLRLNTSDMTETSITTWVPDSNEDDESYDYTPTRPNRRTIVNNLRSDGFLSTMSYDSGPRRPRFLFRAFEVNHGLNARRFVTSRTIPDPPRFVTQDFEDEVRPHLSRDKTYNSPFLSFTQNPAVALKHAFNKVAEGVRMAFVIVRYDDLRNEAVSRHGVDSGPYLVPAICKSHDLWTLPGAYTGVGEFLVWGWVQSEPVAVITTTNALMIRAVLRTTTRIDHAAGMRLRRYLPPNMNAQDKELFLYQLVKGYRVSGRQVARKDQAWLDFVRGASTTADQIPGPATNFANPIVISDTEDEEWEVVDAPNASPVYARDWRSDTE